MSVVILDIETYPNHTLYAFKRDDVVLKFSIVGKDSIWSAKDKKAITRILRNNTIVTFNGIKYDIPMVLYGIKDGTTVEQMYNLSTKLITGKTSAWQVYRSNKLDPSFIDHIDIIEPSPSVGVGLKLYGARGNTKTLQDLPYDPTKSLNSKQIKKLAKYCVNDLIITEELYAAIKGRIDLREKLSKQYGLDLRSKSDPQIAESVIIKELGYKGKAPSLGADYTIKYTAPKYIHFKTQQLKDFFKLVNGFEFKLHKSTKKPILPKEISRAITINQTQYKVGIGGLHSMEKSITVIGGMRNADITSMYPSLIENQKLYPEHLGKAFLDLFCEFKDVRIEAKPKLKTLDKDSKEYENTKLIVDGYKIMLNGSYGKFGSKYSKLFSPDLLLQTTITGQLTLLMLIEELEENGITVISANTDGVEAHCPTKKKQKLFDKIVLKQGKIANLGWEIGAYKSLHARDVNNYVAKYDGYVKAKGVYGEPSLQKNPEFAICYKAVRDYIQYGIPLEKTIDECDDVTQFLASVRVTKGAYWGTPIFGESVPVVGTTGKTRMVKVVKKWSKDTKYLGKVIRFYNSTDGKPIFKGGDGATVPLTADMNGVTPMMKLKKKIPKNLNYEYYYEFARKALENLGTTLSKTKG